MGALFSCCCGEEEDSGSDAGERTRLIRWIWDGSLVMISNELLMSMRSQNRRISNYTFQEYLSLKDQTYHYHALKTVSHLALTHLILHSLSVTVLVMVEPWCLTACIVKEETVLGDSLRCLSRFGARSLNLLSGVQSECSKGGQGRAHSAKSDSSRHRNGDH